MKAEGAVLKDTASHKEAEEAEGENIVLSPEIGIIYFLDFPYQNLFSDVRNYEAFKLIHLGMLCQIPRKSLPGIARAVGLKDSQGLNHFLRTALNK
ncbi:MAG: hypothetical protein ACRC1Z_12065 [Waterburya sp.]